MKLLALALAAQLLTGNVSSEGIPLKGVVVSDGHNITVTDSKGNYKLPSEMPEGYVFISVPSGYEVRAEGLIPQFFTRKKKNARFELKKVDQSDCKIVFMTDVHLTGDKVDNDLAQFRTQFFPSLCRAVRQLKENNPVYTICLGDMCTNGKWYKNNFCYPELLKEFEAYPTPLFNIMGNHDNDDRCQGTPKEWESLAEQKYIAALGPKYYSMNIGGYHFLMLDDIITNGPKAEGNSATNFIGKYSYTFRINPEQIEWIKKDLEYVPSSMPIVICIHCPLYMDGRKEMENAEELLALVKDRRDVNVFSGHCHTTRVTEIAPHITEHILGSGSAVSWKLNDIQAPIICDDGTPAGWQIVSIKNGKMSWQFQSAYRSVEDSQISLFDNGDGYIFADIFNWDPSWEVNAFCEGKKLNIQQFWSFNPDYERIRHESKALAKRPMSFLGMAAPHYFRCYTKGDRSTFILTAVDRFGNRYTAKLGHNPYPQWGMSATTVFRKGEDGYDTFRIPAIIRNAKGNLLAFAEGRRNGSGDSGDIDLVLKRSDDNGLTWGPLQTVWDDAGNVCGNPCPVVDRASGRIILIMTWNDGRDKESDIHGRKSIDTRKVFVCTSEDDGLTWSRPEDITSQTKRPEWTWYATGPCHACQAHSGRIIVPCNHGVFGKNGPEGTASHIIYSDDCGVSWHIGGICETGNETAAAFLPDSSLMLNVRRCKHESDPYPYRMVGFSKDNGNTISRLEFDSQLPDPRCQGSLLTADGATYFCNPSSLKGRYLLTVQKSTDNRNWERWAFMPGYRGAYSDLVDLGDDRIGVLYESGAKQGTAYDTILFATFRK